MYMHTYIFDSLILADEQLLIPSRSVHIVWRGYDDTKRFKFSGIWWRVRLRKRFVLLVSFAWKPPLHCMVLCVNPSSSNKPLPGPMLIQYTSPHGVTAPQSIDPFHQSQNASEKYPRMHHFVTEMCTHVHISVTKCCIVGYGTIALWDLWTRSTTGDVSCSFTAKYFLHRKF